MFVTQPPTTPGQSSHRTPPASLSPMHSSPPTVIQSKKRSRSTFEDAVQTGMRSLNENIERMSGEIRLGQERLEQKMDEERTKRQLLEHHWEERFLLVRNDDRTEREHVALEFEERLRQDMQKNEAERKRIEQALAEKEMRLTDLHGQVQCQNERMKSRMDKQASQLSVHQGQLDAQRARNLTISSNLETYAQKQAAHKKTQDALEERLKKVEVQAKLDRMYFNDKLQVLEAGYERLRDLEAAHRPAGPAATKQQGLARARSVGGQKPHIHEVRQREAWDWDMHGKKPGLLSDSLIERGLPPLQPRTPGGSLVSSSSSRSVQPQARNSNASNSKKPNEGAHQQNRSVQTGPD